ncbi:MAG: hypothetical protein ABI573_07790 [Chloroflexota bacterium]
MFEPMFDSRELIFGLSHRMVVAAVGLTGLLIGFLWIRRIFQPDPETRIFAVYTRVRSRQRTALLAGLVLAAVAITLIIYLKA